MPADDCRRLQTAQTAARHSALIGQPGESGAGPSRLYVLLLTAAPADVSERDSVARLRLQLWAFSGYVSCLVSWPRIGSAVCLKVVLSDYDISI